MEVSPISAPLLQTPTPTTLSTSLRSSLLLPILTIVQMYNSLNDQPKRKVLHVLGKTILKLFIQKSIQQNVRIHMITADARSSNVLHDTSTIANTPGPTLFTAH